MAENKKTLYIDYNLCIGCESCEAVCGYLYGHPRIHMTRTSDGITVPISCHHCANPACLKACNVNAFYQDDEGAVILDPKACVGCMVCLSVCPFAAISHSRSGPYPVAKCDLCAERRAKGMLPACVEICPCGAILYGSPEDIEAELRQRVAEGIVQAHMHPERFGAEVGLRAMKKSLSVEGFAVDPASRSEFDAER
ncbi:MAG TPA: 4Fe-4S dicluster domain-containing protein [Desulfonatronum sp.]|mgnify:CR=1 FL=1|nr:4Fe-4S dicluster domain-containing protein [Desulfonatronum sp.]